MEGTSQHKNHVILKLLLSSKEFWIKTRQKNKQSEHEMVRLCFLNKRPSGVWGFFPNLSWECLIAGDLPREAGINSFINSTPHLCSIGLGILTALLHKKNRSSLSARRMAEAGSAGDPRKRRFVWEQACSLSGSRASWGCLSVRTGFRGRALENLNVKSVSHALKLDKDRKRSPMQVCLRLRFHI